MDPDNSGKKDKIILLIGIIILGLAAFIYKSKEAKNSEIVIENDVSQDILSENFPSEKNNVMKVHITGEINNPGVYEIQDGDRLEDLTNKAGGLTANADINQINLSQKLSDEMRIIIPSIIQDNNSFKEENTENRITDENQNRDYVNIAIPDGNNNMISNPSDNSDLININSASKEELMKLPNIGEKRAEAIIEYRSDNKFEKIEDLMKVTGIGQKYFDALKDQITV
ncbi:MAG: helix-hairpin-helix domain-containing protein [Peptoniphilaceae bacterium]|nr:helix-hairpin-helix domain-containing protein [Peptoniphilaceae bacterium]MDD7383480.1 helix-hairpin-helix domain-containing protein [Peptoniphilaceae bacterium]MDY3738458.1 helix-hairpin-helix domain-containing protein [Peptoniphilaceae bacterium]